MPGILKIVATPIGNISDISQRAIKEISEASLILAEDTRQSLKLLKLLNLKLKEGSKIISFDAHKEKFRFSLVKEHLDKNESIVLLSDAGCPTISDPGSLLIEHLVGAGYDIEVIPGPSALTAAIMGSGLDMSSFVFLGFLPKKGKEKIITPLINTGLSLVIFESPLRIEALLKELFDLLGPRRVVVGRELTKLYESFHRGILGQELRPKLVEKGECVLMIEGAKISDANINEQEVMAFINKELLNQQKTKDIIDKLKQRFNIRKNKAYDLIIKTMTYKDVPPG